MHIVGCSLNTFCAVADAHACPRFMLHCSWCGCALTSLLVQEEQLLRQQRVSIQHQILKGWAARREWLTAHCQMRWEADLKGFNTLYEPKFLLSLSAYFMNCRWACMTCDISVHQNLLQRTCARNKPLVPTISPFVCAACACAAWHAKVPLPNTAVLECCMIIISCIQCLLQSKTAVKQCQTCHAPPQLTPAGVTGNYRPNERKFRAAHNMVNMSHCNWLDVRWFKV